jgi:hypothetical protein
LAKGIKGWERESIATRHSACHGEVINEIFSKADAFLLGRTTDDIFAGY